MKTIINKYLKKIGLVSKITGIITIILISATAILCLFYYSKVKESILKETEEKLIRELGELEQTMDNNLDMTKGVINDLVYRQEFAYFLNKRNELSQRELRYYTSNMQSELNKIRNLYPYKFYQIAVYSSNNQIEVNNNWQYDILKLQEKEYYKDIIDSKESLVYGEIRKAEFLTSTLNIENLNIENDGALILPVYLKIFDISTKDLVGILELDLYVDKLVDSRHLLNVMGEKEYILFGKNKKINYHIGKFNHEKIEDIEFENERGIKRQNIEGEVFLLAYSKIEDSDIVRSVLISEKKTLQFIHAMMFKVIVSVVIGSICLIWCIYTIIRRMLNRLVVLDEKMSEIESGHFDVIIEDDGNQDEISRIKKRFNKMVSKLSSVLNTAIENEKAQREAELKSLQAQINPHFLYNTLENMRMQCEVEGYDKIGDSLVILGDLFRYSVKWGSSKVPFKLEWQNLINYISIMQMRYEDEIKFIMEKQIGIDDVIVPKMILQPLIENSFNHGFKQKLPPWLVIVRAFKEKDSLVIIIEDNGVGIKKERLDQIKASLDKNKKIEGENEEITAIGILNVKQRIDIICKSGSGVTIDSQEGLGIKIRIQIMLEEE